MTDGQTGQNAGYFADEQGGPTSRVVAHSGLFDALWYLSIYPDLEGIGPAALAHYCCYGWREGRKPNPFFEPQWYLKTYPSVSGEPLLHYIQEGEAAGFRPLEWFDPVWYREAWQVPDDMLCLRHYLLNRHRPGLCPVAEFDPAFYLDAYPDVAAAGLDPLEHYMIQGFREERKPFAGFDPVFYRAKYLETQQDENPLLHYLRHREDPNVFPALPRNQSTVSREVRKHVVRGDLFEDRRPLPESAVRRARVLAYYLPQFHSIPENDVWWGNGFTEWTSIARGLPRFTGHYQPRVPRDLGHYTLDNADIIRQQARMAREAGIEGFVFYFYWFNQKRLLEKPLEIFLNTPDIDMPFCLMWANENWSRRWDGSDDDVLIAQDFREEDEDALISCFVRHFRDSRYIRIQGRPLLMIYRPAQIPECAASIERWKTKFSKISGDDPIFIMSQTFGSDDPREFGMDGAIEFPPHKIVSDLKTINHFMDVLDPDFSGQVYDYDQIVTHALGMPTPDFPLIRTASPSWDNDARRQGKGLVMHGATPDGFARWLGGLVEQANRHPFFGEPFVCINAWNEWAEGAYLEPDQHYGAAFLNSCARVVSGYGNIAENNRILLVGHDAFPAGAQMLLCHIGRVLRRVHGMHVRFLLLGAGDLIGRYREEGEVDIVTEGEEKLALHVMGLANEGFRRAIVNTAAASSVSGFLDASGIGFIQLVHELSSIISARNLGGFLARSMELAQCTVFPSEYVARCIKQDIKDYSAENLILPQGLYADVSYAARSRIAMRQSLGVEQKDRVILASGYGDMRKGFDLFLQLWRQTEEKRQDQSLTHLVWTGDIDPEMRRWLASEIRMALASGRFHLPGRVDDMSGWFSAADAFVLTSREDPYPSVVMEAMTCGLPCIVFADTGGASELVVRMAPHFRMTEADVVVPVGDIRRLSQKALYAAQKSLDGGNRERLRRVRLMQNRFPFGNYVERLLSLAAPQTRRISVVVLSYNYARYLAARLASIFAQNYPVFEILVLDDASQDNSIDVACETAKEWGRDIRLITSEQGSGNVFAQWKKAVAEARGDWIWIAEADDVAAPDFLKLLSGALDAAPEAVMAFCDSRAIDADDQMMWPGYRSYYADVIGDMLDQDAVHDGAGFVSRCLGERNLVMNASAVLFQRTALEGALERCRDLETFHIAGDWRIYVELLTAPGAQVAYVVRSLNDHRRHGASATGSVASSRHLAEIVRMHHLIRDLPVFANDAEASLRRESYRSEVARTLGLSEKEMELEDN